MYYTNMSDIHPYLGVPKLVYKPKSSVKTEDIQFDEIVVKEVTHKPFEKSDFVFYECYDVSGELQYEKVEPPSLPSKPSSQIINIHKNYPECVHRMILYFSFVRPRNPR
jgi:hypothetical protein